MEIMLHLLGDIMTYQKFKPLWPISQWKVALGKFKADNKIANDTFFYLGIAAFLIYIIESSGMTELLISVYEDMTKLVDIVR